MYEYIVIMNKRYKDTDAHNLYYNITIRSGTIGVEVPATYQETRTETIVDECLSDYECTVARFKVPSDSIPLFVFQPGLYSVTLTDLNNVDHTVPLVYIVNSSIPINYVWEYSQWADMLNFALATAYNSLTGTKPACPPFFIFNPDTQKYSLYATTDYNSVPNQSGKVQIWFNSGAFEKLEFFDVFYNSVPAGNPLPTKFANLLVKQYGNNQIVANFSGVGGLNCQPSIFNGFSPPIPSINIYIIFVLLKTNIIV